MADPTSSTPEDAAAYERQTHASDPEVQTMVRAAASKGHVLSFGAV
jgi:hypothetical protein